MDQQLKSVLRVGRTKTYSILALTAFLAGGNHPAIGEQSMASSLLLLLTFGKVTTAFGMQQASSFSNLSNRKNKYFPVTHPPRSRNLTHTINEIIDLGIFDPAMNFDFWKEGK